MSLKNIKLRSSINFKITLMTLIAILISIGIFSVVIYVNFIELNNTTLEIIDVELRELSNQYYRNYIDEIAEHISENVNNFNQELLVLSDITKTYFENTDENLIKALKNNDYYEDELEFSGKWYQNTPTDSTSIFVQGYLLDEKNQIKERPQQLLDESLLLDLILPSFGKYGTTKIQAYFQGGKESEIVRMSPWKNIGEDVFNVYPELNDVPIWDTFNPGLVEAWESEFINRYNSNQKNLDIGRVTPPVIDGVTGEIVLTYSQPIIKTKSAKLIGAVSFDVPIEFIVDKVQNVNLGEVGFAFLTQSNGNIFAIPDRGASLLGLETLEESTQDFSTGFSVLERYFINSKYSSVKGLNDRIIDEQNPLKLVIENKNYILFEKTLKAYNSWNLEKGFYDEFWTLGFVIPEDDLFSMYYKTKESTEAHLSKTMKKLVYYMSIIVILLISGIIYYNRKITYSLAELARATDGIKHKNYDVKLKIKSKDEIGQLSMAFNEMANELKNNFLKMTDQNEKLLEEIEEGKRRDKMINYLENFDEYTNLPNKRVLLNYLTDFKIKQNQKMISLVIMGIDDFRKINEAYGYKTGDELIKLIAERLRNLFEINLIFKLKGDEFGLIIESKDFNDLIIQIENTRKKMKEVYITKNKNITITSSMGVSSYPYDSENPEDLYKFALMAMSHTKEMDKGAYGFYNKNTNENVRHRLEMISELSMAINRDEFEVVYQPIVNLSDESWNGVEALLRWKNKKFGFVSPEIFIPLAEESMEIVEIGNWVLRRSLSDIKKLHDKNYNIDISINLSVIQVVNKNFYKDITEIVSNSGVDSKFIHLEITENIFIEDTSKVTSILNLLKDYGFSISIDDFGTGYSSLAYLKDLPISKLKIDKNFVIDLKQKTNQEIINAIIGLSTNLNFKVIAEGIETLDQKKYLISNQCQEGQGYYFSKPIKYEELEYELHKHYLD